MYVPLFILFKQEMLKLQLGGYCRLNYEACRTEKISLSMNDASMSIHLEPGEKGTHLLIRLFT
jgi:hypothetical protein